jgi:hypothetical protein
MVKTNDRLIACNIGGAMALARNRNLLANLKPPIDFKRYYFPKNLASATHPPWARR